MRVALLVRESANRVYADASARLLVAEVRAVASTMHVGVVDPHVDTIGGVDYVVFATADGAMSSVPLDDRDRRTLSELSTVRAIFQLDDGPVLRPIPTEPAEYFDEDLVTIQRYPGKTNEQFTHLLVNVALAAAPAARRRRDRGERVRLLDPVAGRGSTLNRALLAGFDATGVEVVEADADQYRTFLSQYLRDHRIKHTTEREKIRKGPLAGTSSITLTIRREQRMHLVCGDTRVSRHLLRGRRFELVVGDLPYGVHHRSTGAAAARRSPEDLLAESIDGWADLLVTGGAVALSWNTRTMPRAFVEEAVERAGLSIVGHPESFEHVVDRSITRDLLVATK
ncbi:MAG: SAM-dependent methyltransferase [Actinomycetota bacterium]